MATQGTDHDPTSPSIEANSSRASSRCSTPDPIILESYDKLMSTLIPLSSASIAKVPQVVVDETLLNEGDEPSRPMTKAEKQNAKKKRRKERERDEKAAMNREERERIELEKMSRPVCMSRRSCHDLY